MRIPAIIVSSVSVSIYLLTLMGVGRYSCNCDHASQIAVLGIHTQCSCTDQPHHEHHDHKCICGAHLEAQESQRDDCCSVSYYFLDSDQNILHTSFDFIQTDYQVLQPISTICLGVSMIQRPRIKNYQALFRSASVPIFEKNRQLIL